MARYLISFNDGAMDHITAEEPPDAEMGAMLRQATGR